MSGKAAAWALRQLCARPNTKLVLMVLAAHADPKGLAWPSYAALTKETGLHRKAIIREMKSLSRLGRIEDSGARRGKTNRVKVWRLTLEQDSLSLSGNSPRAGTIKRTANSPGYRDHSIRRNGPSREMVPISTPNGPSGGTWNRKEEYTVTNVTASRAHAPAREAFQSPAGVPDDVWHDFLHSPKRRKAGMSPTAYKGICNSLQTLADNGYPPGDMVALAVERGWLTVKLEWVQNDRGTKAVQQSADGLSSTARAALAVFGPDRLS